MASMDDVLKAIRDGNALLRECRQELMLIRRIQQEESGMEHCGNCGSANLLDAAAFGDDHRVACGECGTVMEAANG